MKYRSFTSFNSDSTLIRLISLIKHQHVPRIEKSSSKCFFRLIPRWDPAEYFSLKAEIGCPVLFTGAAFCLRREEMDRQNKTPGQSIEATDWNVRCFVFQPASHVRLSWRCAGVHWGQLRDSLSWKLRCFRVHLSFRPGSDCFFSAAAHLLQTVKERTGSVYCLSLSADCVGQMISLTKSRYKQRRWSYVGCDTIILKNLT